MSGYGVYVFGAQSDRDQRSDSGTGWYTAGDVERQQFEGSTRNVLLTRATKAESDRLDAALAGGDVQLSKLVQTRFAKLLLAEGMGPVIEDPPGGAAIPGTGTA
jgi:hypothetical protein